MSLYSKHELRSHRTAPAFDPPLHGAKQGVRIAVRIAVRIGGLEPREKFAA